MFKQARLFLVVIVCSLACLCSSIQAQTAKIDSLKAILKTHKQDTIAINALNSLGHEYISLQVFDSSIICCKTANKLSSIIKYDHGKIGSLLLLGNAYSFIGQYQNSLSCYFSLLKIASVTKNKVILSTVYSNIGLIFFYTLKYDKSLDFYYKSLELQEELGDQEKIAELNENFGNLFQSIGNYMLAEEYILKALNYYENKDMKSAIGRCLLNLSETERCRGYFEKSLQTNLIALKIKEKLKDTYAIAIIHYNIGDYYQNMGQIDSAIFEYQLALNNSSKVLDALGLVMTKIKLSECYFLKCNFIKSKSLVLLGLKEALKINAVDEISNAYLQLSKLNSVEKKFKEALENYRLHLKFKEQLRREDVNRQLTSSLLNYEFDKKQQLEQQKQAQKEIAQEAEIRKQQIVRNIVIVVVVITALFLILLFRNYKSQQKANQLLEEQQIKITAHRNQIDQQKQLIEVKQKEVLASIQYAKRIQQTLLTSEEYIKRFITDFFILYQPKEVVSGDFYWALSSKDKSKFIIATADCTGHGVPGALMSLLSINCLNEAVVQQQLTQPDLILNAVRTELINSLHVEDILDGNKDGMDCVLCTIDLNTLELQYAVANNSLWIIRKRKPLSNLPEGERSIAEKTEVSPEGYLEGLGLGGDFGLIECNGDKMSVGEHYGKITPFTLHTVQLQKGDVVYTFTDGYADQFGGANGKKFNYKALQELLIANCHLPMPVQKQVLTSAFNDWKGDLEQVDDVLLIGMMV